MYLKLESIFRVSRLQTWLHHVSKSCKSKSRCLLCEDAKHVSPEFYPRAQTSHSCINCFGDHLAMSYLYPQVIKHKMILSLTSAKNIPYSEAKKSISFPSHNSSSPSSQLSDPRYDLVNFSLILLILVQNPSFPHSSLLTDSSLYLTLGP